MKRTNSAHKPSDCLKCERNISHVRGVVACHIRRNRYFDIVEAPSRCGYFKKVVE